MSEHAAAQVIGAATLGARGPSRALKPDAQGFDEVRIITVPRFKESGLSGDEWRISASIQVFRKGNLIHEQDYRNVETAAAYLPALLGTLNDDGKAFYAGEGDVCDQEGCCAPATVTYKLKAQYCRDGHKSELFGPTIRKFCERHKHRGDCGLEDSDDNYEPFV
jgi:hypothetical protein